MSNLLGTLPATGPLQTAVVLCDFPDAPWVSFSREHAEAVVFGEFGPWVERCSLGRASLVNVGTVGPVMMPKTLAQYAAEATTLLPDGRKAFWKAQDDPPWNGLYWGSVPNAIHEAARSLCKPFFDLYAQRVVIFVFEGIGTYGEGGGGITFLSATNGVDLKTLCHEGGHALGRFRHGALLGIDGVPPDLVNLPYATRYGDFLDPMGSSVGHYRAGHKLALGWTDPTRTKTLYGSGYTMLGNVETGWGGTLDLRLPLGDAGHYAIEKRAAGVFLRYVPAVPGDADSYLLLRGKPIAWTQTIVDPYRGIRITNWAEMGPYALIQVQRT